MLAFWKVLYWGRMTVTSLAPAKGTDNLPQDDLPRVQGALENILCAESRSWSCQHDSTADAEADFVRIQAELCSVASTGHVSTRCLLKDCCLAHLNEFIAVPIASNWPVSN